MKWTGNCRSRFRLAQWSGLHLEELGRLSHPQTEPTETSESQS